MLPYWENYERELEVLDFGLPIWQAEPFDERDEVQVGDVGYVDEGRFRRVFNIFYGDTRITETTGSNGHQSQGPSTEPQPQPSSRATFRPAQYEAPLPNEYGVPDGHVPLQMPATEFRLHGRISKGWHYRGDYKSTEVSSQGGIDMTTPIPLESSVSFSFKSESQRFAALMLRTHGDHYKAPEGIFKAYSRRRWKQWRAFTSNQDAHYMHATKLMLVYGYTKTTAWTTVAIEGQRSSGRLEFNVDLPALGSTGLDVQHRREATTSPHTNHGPWRPQMETEDEESVATLSTANPGLKQNQTVFIRRIMASEMSALERLRLAVRYRFGGRSGSGGVRRPLYERARDMVRRLGHPTIQGGDVASSRDHEKHSPADSEIGSTDADRHSHSSSATASRSSDDSYNISPGHHYVDPLEELLLYVLETERKAVSAVVSDDDVSKLTKIYKSSHDNRLPADMTELVKELRPETTTDEDGIAYLCGLDQSQAITPRPSESGMASKDTDSTIQEFQDIDMSSSPNTSLTTENHPEIEEQSLHSASRHQLFWFELFNQASALCASCELLIRSVTFTINREKLLDLQRQASSMLDEAKKFLGLLSPEDMQRLPENPTMLFLEQTANIVVLLYRRIEHWAFLGFPAFLMRASATGKIIRDFSGVIERYQMIYTKVRLACSPTSVDPSEFIRVLLIIGGFDLLNLPSEREMNYEAGAADRHEALIIPNNDSRKLLELRRDAGIPSHLNRPKPGESMQLMATESRPLLTGALTAFGVAQAIAQDQVLEPGDQRPPTVVPVILRIHAYLGRLAFSRFKHSPSSVYRELHQD